MDRNRVIHWNDELLEWNMHKATKIVGDIRVRDLERIRQLELSYYDYHSDISPLVHLKNVRTLRIGIRDSVDLSIFRRMPKLRSLAIICNGTLDMSEIGKLRHLRHLHICGDDGTDCKLKNCHALANLTQLRSLKLEWTAKIDFEFLGGMRQLRRLEFPELGPCWNVEMIAYPPKLRYVFMMDMILDDVNFLKAFHDLDYLDVSLCWIRDPSALSGIREMAKEYCICGNELYDTSCIDALGDDENVTENEEVSLEDMNWYKEGPSKDYWRMEDHHLKETSPYYKEMMARINGT